MAVKINKNNKNIQIDATGLTVREEKFEEESKWEKKEQKVTKNSKQISKRSS